MQNIIIGKSKITGNPLPFGTHSDAVQVTVGNRKINQTTYNAELSQRIKELEDLIGVDASGAIDKFNEIVAFLASISDQTTLAGILQGINEAIAAKYTKPEGGIPTIHIANEAIIESKLADGAVSEQKLQNNAVTTGKIKDGAVTNSKLGEMSVSTDKIQNEAITIAKLAGLPVINLQTYGRKDLVNNSVSAQDLTSIFGSDLKNGLWDKKIIILEGLWGGVSNDPVYALASCVLTELPDGAALPGFSELVTAYYTIEAVAPAGASSQSVKMTIFLTPNGLGYSYAGGKIVNTNLYSLSDNEVTTSKIQDEAVTPAKLGSLRVFDIGDYSAVGVYNFDQNAAQAIFGSTGNLEECLRKLCVLQFNSNRYYLASVLQFRDARYTYYDIRSTYTNGTSSRSIYIKVTIAGSTITGAQLTLENLYTVPDNSLTAAQMAPWITFDITNYIPASNSGTVTLTEEQFNDIFMSLENLKTFIGKPMFLSFSGDGSDTPAGSYKYEKYINIYGNYQNMSVAIVITCTDSTLTTFESAHMLFRQYAQWQDTVAFKETVSDIASVTFE